jgi:hypothetical protein
MASSFQALSGVFDDAKNGYGSLTSRDLLVLDDEANQPEFIE